MRRLCILPLALVASCGILNPKDVDFRQDAINETTRREELWKVASIHDYDFDFQRDCACSLTAVQQVSIHVRNDVITRVVNLQGADVPPQADIPWPTVDSLFLWTRQFLNNRAFAVEIEFDSTHNYPFHIRGEDPGRSAVEHNSANFVVQTATAPIVAGYRRADPFSKSNRVTWRSR